MGFVSRSSAASQNSDFVGAIRHFGTASLPSGYLPCDGAAVSRATYANLFAAIGTAFGAGDGSTTFNVPEMRGRTLIGDGTGPGLSARTRGAQVGAETHPLTLAELAQHNHSINDPGHSHTYPVGVGHDDNNGTDGVLNGRVQNSDVNVTSYSGTTSAPGTGITINNNGSGNAHNNMQPSTVVKYGIRYLDSVTAPSACQAIKMRFSSNFLTTASAWQKLPFDLVVRNNISAVATYDTGLQRLTANVAGWYEVQVNGYAATGGTGSERYAIGVYVNGGNEGFTGGNLSTSDTPLSGHAQKYYLNIGDYIEIWMFTIVAMTLPSAGSGGHDVRATIKYEGT